MLIAKTQKAKMAYEQVSVAWLAVFITATCNVTGEIKSVISCGNFDNRITRNSHIMQWMSVSM